jgi:Leucine-rich repeat (LRR) protein
MYALWIACVVLAIVGVRPGYGITKFPDCNLTSFPSTIAPEETIVEFNNCPFSEIYPGEIDYLTALIELIMINNPRITNFPNLTAVAGTLQSLRMGDCSVTYIPPELLSPLVNLKKLNLARNQLTVLPIVPELTQMTNLLMRQNRLTEVPDVTAWTTLEFVDLSDMPITSVDPESFAGLNQLATLKLEYLTFTELPRLEVQQDQLNRLDLSGSSIALMPAHTTAVLRNLTILNLVDTAQLEFLPTLCTRDLPSLSIDVSGSGLRLCDCRHAWLRAAVEAGATVTAHPTVCWGQDWASMTTAHFLTYCEQNNRGDNMSKIITSF